MPSGQNAKWTKCQVDKMPSGQNTKKKKCHVDKLPSGQNAKLTNWKIDNLPSRPKIMAPSHRDWKTILAKRTDQFVKLSC
jgi:hypothetical protein